MKNFFLITITILLTAAVSFLVFVLMRSEKKFGYISTQKVFEEFKLKKELEDKLKKIQLAKQTYLDSLKLKIQTLSMSTTQEDKVDEYKKIYLMKEEQLNRESELLFNQYNDQIWKQLNQYLEDFGKENKYDYLFGTSGQGNIMYACEADDVTSEVTKYINDKYMGKGSLK